MGHPSSKYTAEFKQRAAGFYRERGCTYAELARELGCDAGGISDWVRRADASGAAPDRNPFQMAEGPRGAEARERPPQDRERDAFKSRRPLRRPSAVGSAAKRAKFAFISADEGSWRVSDMRPALGAAGRGHCAWRRRGPSARDERDLELTRLISEVYEASRRIYGAPKAHMEPRRRGFRTSRKRVARLMRDNGWEGTTRGCARRPKGTPKAAAPQANAAPDLVGRDFSASGPDEAWFADITYVRTRRGWPCLALVMDIWPGRAVGVVDVRPHGRRAGRRRAQDGDRPQEAARRPHTPLGPRVAVRVAPARPHHGGGRRQALDGGDLVAVGQRRDGVADGPREGGVRARAHLREPRAGGA